MNNGYTDYSYNRLLGNAAGATPAVISESALTYTTNTVLLCENLSSSSGVTIAGGPGGGTGGAAGGLATLRDGTNGAALRHLDGSNFAFADGQVKWYKGVDADTPAAVYNDNTPPTGSNATFDIN